MADGLSAGMMLGAPGAPMMAAPMPAGVAPAAAAMQAAQLHSQQQQMLQQQQLQLHMFWQQQMREISDVDPDAEDFKTHQLPLARIKKIMKSDDDVRMISAEAPVLFAKACEIFILELTLRAWIHTEENKRRTLQRNDIAMAISKNEVFDFLIDIVPRDDIKPAKKEEMVRSQPFMNEMQQMLLMQQQAQAAQAAQLSQGDPRLSEGYVMYYMQQAQAQAAASAAGGADGSAGVQMPVVTGQEYTPEALFQAQQAAEAAAAHDPAAAQMAVAAAHESAAAHMAAAAAAAGLEAHHSASM